MTLTFFYKGYPQPDSEMISDVDLNTDPALEFEYQASFADAYQDITVHPSAEIKHKLLYNLLMSSMISIIDDEDEEMLFYSDSGFQVRVTFDEPEKEEEEESDDEEGGEADEEEEEEKEEEETETSPIPTQNNTGSPEKPNQKRENQKRIPIWKW